jgi:hypothetical protein
LISTLGRDAYHLSQIKTWLQRFKNGDLSCKDHSRPGRPVLTLGSRLETSLLKYPFASARVIAQHFCTTAPTIKDILHRELGIRKFSRHWVPYFFSEAQKAAGAEASKEMLQILQDSEGNKFDGIVTGDESWFRHLYPCSKMLARWPAEVVPRIRQGIDTKKAMVTIFFTRRELIVVDVLPKGSKFNQLYCIDYVFSDLKSANLNFCRRKPG